MSKQSGDDDRRMFDPAADSAIKLFFCSSFEIGLQSTNASALRLMNRPTDLRRLVKGARLLKERGILPRLYVGLFPFPNLDVSWRFHGGDGSANPPDRIVHLGGKRYIYKLIMEWARPLNEVAVLAQSRFYPISGILF